MPDDVALTRLYGTEYAQGADGIEDPKQPERSLQTLQRCSGTSFLDYGCGRGELLSAVSTLGWRPMGVEAIPAVAKATSEQVGVTVVTPDEAFDGAVGQVDVLHLGDVLEHLTNLDADVTRILGLVRGGGTVIAQGPLEANRNLFTAVVAFARRARRVPDEKRPPFHVTLATAKGQRCLFERAGLHTVEWTVTEVDWPAPSKVTVALRQGRRALALFFLRRLSRKVTAVLPWMELGNRYFYVGALPDGREMPKA